jgi:predicted RNase H-like nuclease (RuvC/YqgF family)
MTETKTIIEALRILARDIQSEDGVANAAIAEAADRLEKQQRKIRNQRREIEALAKDKHRIDGFCNWLDAEMKKFMTEPTLRNDWVQYYSLERAKQQIEKLRNGLGEQ